MKAIDDIGRATAADVKEALHQVIDLKLGIDALSGLVYGMIDESFGRHYHDDIGPPKVLKLTDLIEDGARCHLRSRNNSASDRTAAVLEHERSLRRKVASSYARLLISIVCQNTTKSVMVNLILI